MPFRAWAAHYFLLMTYALRLTTYEFLHVRGATPPRYSYDALSGLGLLTTFYL